MKVSKEAMKDMYLRMIRIREFESKAQSLFADGKIPGFVHLYLGEEAVATGVCACLRDDDYITSTHRGHGHIIAKGGDLKFMMAELFGKATGYCKGKGGSMHIADRDKGILGANGIVGAGHNIAVGAGLSASYRGTDQVCVCFFGDGSTNQGTFHEALNLASIWKLPIVFVCENNNYGISMSQSRHQAIKDVADRGFAYGIPGIEGDPAIYKPKEEQETWLKKDPISKFAAFLKESNLLTEEEMEALKKQVQEELEEAIRFAEESPDPTADSVVQDVYSDIIEEVRTR